MSPGRSAAAAYARAVQRCWARHVDHAKVLSPREWELVRSWHVRGIPLEIVEQAIASAVEGRRRPPRSLAHLGAAVEESWAVVCQGRSPTPDGAPRPGSDPRLEWTRCRDRAPRGSALARLLDGLLDALARGEQASEVERRLDEAIVDAAPRELLLRVSGDVDRDLAPFRSRLGERTLSRTRTRALAKRLREALGLPRLGDTET
jgi:hypothetical protein